MNNKLKNFREELEQELLKNILPFWNNAVDNQNGGFVGRIDHQNNIDYSHEKSVILNARILWTYSAVYNVYKNKEYLKLAERAFIYLLKYFRDIKHGGVFFMLDCKGNPIDQTKHTFAHAYMIYGLSEYYKASHNVQAIEWAVEIFNLIEDKTFDNSLNGYYDQFTKDWRLIENKKSLGSQLHTLEAYSNLYTIWANAFLKQKIQNLISLFVCKIIDADSCKFGVCFDKNWLLLSDVSSLGHNAEGAWLIHDACKTINYEKIEDVDKNLFKIIEKLYQVALDADGSVFYELLPDGSYNKEKQWWPQCETMISFFMLYNFNNDDKYANSLLNIWNYLNKNFIDKNNGGWVSMIGEDLKPAKDSNKLGPWKCPYHNTRTCLTLIKEIEDFLKTS